MSPDDLFAYIVYGAIGFAVAGCILHVVAELWGWRFMGRGGDE